MGNGGGRGRVRDGKVGGGGGRGGDPPMVQRAEWVRSSISLGPSYCPELKGFAGGRGRGTGLRILHLAANLQHRSPAAINVQLLLQRRRGLLRSQREGECKQADSQTGSPSAAIRP